MITITALTLMVGNAYADPCSELGLPASQCTTDKVIVDGYKMAREATIDVASLEVRVKKLEASGGGESTKAVCRDLRLEILAGVYALTDVPDKWVKACKSNGIDFGAQGGAAPATTTLLIEPITTGTTTATATATTESASATATVTATSTPSASIVMAGAGRDCSEDDRAAGNRSWCTPNASVNIGVYTGGIGLVGMRYDSGEDVNGDGQNEFFPINDRQASWLGGLELGAEVVDLGATGRVSLGARVVGGADILGGYYLGTHAMLGSYVDPLHHGKLVAIGGYAYQAMGMDYAAGRVELGAGAGWHPAPKLDFLAEVVAGLNLDGDDSVRAGLTARWSFGLEE